MTEVLLEDIPAPEPEYGYGILANTFSDILMEERQGALVLGLHGPWGTGKSTLLLAIEKNLKDRANTVIVPVNAWKYQEREALWRALIIQVLEALRAEKIGEQGEIDRLERSLYEGFTIKEAGDLKLDWGAAATEAMLLAMRIGSANLVPGTAVDKVGDWFTSLFGRKSGEAKDDDVSKSMERVGKILTRTVTEQQVQRVTSIEQFLTDFRRLVKLAGERKLCILIDDLDRCLPETALEVFEAIKLFLDAPECSYIVALDREVIRRGLAVRYHQAGLGTVDPDEYIEKTISLSFDLPPLGLDYGQALLKECAPGVNLTDAELEELVGLLGTNPRRLKRVGRNLALLWTLASVAPEPPEDVPSPLSPENRALFLKLTLLSYRNSATFGRIIKDKGLPIRLQSAANQFSTQLGKKGEAEALYEIRSQMKIEHVVVQQAAEDPVMWRILSMQPPFRDEVEIAKALRWYRGHHLEV